MTDEIMAAERYLLLLLGCRPEGIPSKIHIQKELFLLSKVKPLVDRFFHFQKHYYGPYSEVLNQILEDPVYYPNSVTLVEGRYILSSKGREEFKKLEVKHSSDSAFSETLLAIKLLRDLYDKLSPDEVMFLVYDSHPDYVIYSKKYIPLFLDAVKKKSILDSLLRNGAITDKRYLELLK